MTSSTDGQDRPLSVVDVGILVLEAVSVLHTRGHQRLRVFPGMSGSGLYWRTAVTHASNFTDHGYTHLRDFEAAFHYTTGSEFEVAGVGVDSSTTAAELADRIMPLLPDPGLGPDPEYVAWYGDLMDLVRRNQALPIAYADYFDDEDGWEIGWGSGIRIQAPQPADSTVASPAEEEQHVGETFNPDGNKAPTNIVPAEVSNTANSVAFELMLESLFLSELLQEMWFVRGRVVDVLHSPVDAYGYDLVLQSGGVTRHVQLKTKRLSGKTARYNLSTLLYNQPAACVVVLEWELSPGTSRLALQYRWFGGGPHEPIPYLGEKVAKHTKGDSLGVKKEKPLHRVVALGKFAKVSSMAELAELLFGPGQANDGVLTPPS
jgi:hypothetical protein